MLTFDVHERDDKAPDIPYKLPDDDHPLGYDWKIRYFCYAAAQGQPTLYRTMYEKWPLSDVYEVVTLARQYSQREEEPAGGKNGTARDSRTRLRH